MPTSSERMRKDEAFLQLGQAATSIVDVFCGFEKNCFIETVDGRSIAVARVSVSQDDGEYFPHVWTNMGEPVLESYEVSRISIGDIVRVRLAATNEIVFDRGPFFSDWE